MSTNKKIANMTLSHFYHVIINAKDNSMAAKAFGLSPSTLANVFYRLGFDYSTFKYSYHQLGEKKLNTLDEIIDLMKANRIHEINFLSDYEKDERSQIIYMNNWGQLKLPVFFRDPREVNPTTLINTIRMLPQEFNFKDLCMALRLGAETLRSKLVSFLNRPYYNGLLDDIWNLCNQVAEQELQFDEFPALVRTILGDSTKFELEKIESCKDISLRDFYEAIKSSNTIVDLSKFLDMYSYLEALKYIFVSLGISFIEFKKITEEEYGLGKVIAKITKDERILAINNMDLVYPSLHEFKFRIYDELTQRYENFSIREFLIKPNIITYGDILVEIVNMPIEDLNLKNLASRCNILSTKLSCKLPKHNHFKNTDSYLLEIKNLVDNVVSLNPKALTRPRVLEKLVNDYSFENRNTLLESSLDNNLEVLPEESINISASSASFGFFSHDKEPSLREPSANKRDIEPGIDISRLPIKKRVRI